MKRGIKEIIIFVSGLSIGSISSWLVCKTKYEKKIESEIKSIEEAFNKRLDTIEDEKKVAVDTASKAISGEIKYVGNGELTDDVKARTDIHINGILSRGSNGSVDYMGYYEKNSKETIEVDGIPSEDDEEFENGNGSADFEKATTRTSIVQIPEGEYGSRVGYEYKELYFYTDDEILVDEDEKAIDYPEYLVGNVLEESGFINNTEKTIYVRNNDKSCDFEIMKVFGRYAD